MFSLLREFIILLLSYEVPEVDSYANTHRSGLPQRHFQQSARENRRIGSSQQIVQGQERGAIFAYIHEYY